MNIERLNQIEEIFQAVLKISPAEREAFFNEACGADVELRREVESLLVFEHDSEFFLDNPPESLAARMFAEQENRIDLNDKKIGRYKIVKKIGEGGMGEVFLAEDLSLDRLVAIKILPKEFAADAKRMNRFVREAKNASSLNHPNIITIYEISSEDDIHFIATEYIEGETLRSYLASQSVSLESKLEIAIQIASALDAAHQANIIHRDIKPENVMIRPDGLVKVLDFGLAKLVSGGEREKYQRKGVGENRRTGEDVSRDSLSPSLPRSLSPLLSKSPHLSTTPGMIMGTAAYMSPEQARGKKNDARSDIFSLGIVFYEMLTGRRAFEGETTLESISSILKDEPRPISQILPEVPPEIERIVNKTLRKDPDMRYQTAKDLLIDLKSAKLDLTSHNNLGRSNLPNRDEYQTQILPIANTNENQNHLTKSAELIIPSIKRQKFFYPTLAFLAFALIGFGIFGIYKYSNNQPIKLSVESLKITKLTDSGKVGDRVALSRDGKWLAYSIVEGTKASLWLQQVAVPDSNTQIQAPAETYYRELSFSPDANYLYYSIIEGTGNQMTVYRMPTLGGAARKFLSGINGGINFSPDGKQITYGVEDLERDESILMIADADGTNQRQLVKLKGNDEIASSRGRWSPDGKSIALWVGTNNPHSQELATVSVATGEITRLKTPKFNDFLLWEWLSDGTGLVTLAREKPHQKHEFWQISLPTGEAEKITNDLNNYSSLSLSADSNILATVQSFGTSHLWTIPLDDSAQATQITTGSNADFDPQWTPDGKLVFERSSGDIYIVNPSGGNPQRLTTNSTNRFPRVSPDGRFIIYVSTQTGIPNLWRMDIDGGNPKQLTTEFSVEPSISPDGQEIIYSVGADASRIWKVGIDGGQPVQLTDKESRNAIFSPDGKQFLCRWVDSPNSQPKIAIIPSIGGKPVNFFDLNGGELRWMPDGRSFVYSVNQDKATIFWSQPIDGGAPKQLTNFPNTAQSFNFSPDGKQMAVIRGANSSDVVLISGFGK